MIAPTPELAAALEVLYRALVQVRVLGWEGEQHGLTPQQCAPRRSR